MNDDLLRRLVTIDVYHRDSWVDPNTVAWTHLVVGKHPVNAHHQRVTACLFYADTGAGVRISVECKLPKPSFDTKDLGTVFVLDAEDGYRRYIELLWELHGIRITQMLQMTVKLLREKEWERNQVRLTASFYATNEGEIPSEVVAYTLTHSTKGGVETVKEEALPLSWTNDRLTEELALF